MTMLQKKAIRNVMNGYDKIGEAMEKAGYSKSTSRIPSVLTQSQAWIKAMSEYLPDDMVLNTHREAFKANKWNDYTGEREPDHQVRLKAVDMAYKLKGKGQEGNTTNTQVNIVISDQGYMPSDNVLGYKATLKRK